MEVTITFWLGLTHDHLKSLEAMNYYNRAYEVCAQIQPKIAREDTFRVLNELSSLSISLKSKTQVKNNFTSHQVKI